MAKTKRRLGHSLLTKESSAGVLFTLPFTVGFLMFMIVPMGISLYYSFCEYNILSEPKFIGIDNFVKMFTDDAVYMTSLKVTFFFVFVSVPIRLVFALIVALILLRTTKVTGFYRAAYYLPSIIGGSVAVAIPWKRMFAIDGVVNALLGKIGIETNFSWLGDKRTAIWVLILLSERLEGLRGNKLRRVFPQFAVYFRGGHHRHGGVLGDCSVRVCEMPFSRKKNSVYGNARIHDASGAGPDDSAVSVVSEAGMDRNVRAADCSVLFRDTGILCLSDDKLYRRNSQRAG